MSTNVINDQPNVDPDVPMLTENALRVLQARYLKKEDGKVVETPGQMFRRVAEAIADPEMQYAGGLLPNKTLAETRAWYAQAFYEMMISGRFMPNSPTLMNAGRPLSMLSACFVLPVGDSLPEIFDGVKHTAMIQAAGGGTGFAFDELRPTGDYIKSSGGQTSGPIPFWAVYAEATNAIQQGAFRRGANMGMMYIHHPDILKFLYAKQDLAKFTNYNISVKVTDAWMYAAEHFSHEPHVVRNPRTGKCYMIPKKVDIHTYKLEDLIDAADWVTPASLADHYWTTPELRVATMTKAWPADVYTKKDVWDIIVNNAWKTGEPGLFFIDQVNRQNPTPEVGRIEACNPCGEQPLLPYEACNLGSINLGKFVKTQVVLGGGPAVRPTIDWDSLADTVHLAVRFLDNVIDVNHYPLPEIEKMCKDNRKIGLGVMGFADMLFQLGIPYNSDDGLQAAEQVMRFINGEAHKASGDLATVRGCFPNWENSTWNDIGYVLKMRNAAVTTVAPTGTISIISDCSGGIEPMFSLAFERNVLKDRDPVGKMFEVNRVFADTCKARGIWDKISINEIAAKGTIRDMDVIPSDIRKTFVCAHDISPEWHVMMQASFQKYCDSSISKTINLHHGADPKVVSQVYRNAWQLKCKGITVYRDGCRAEQPMALKESKKAEPVQKINGINPPAEGEIQVDESAKPYFAKRGPAVINAGPADDLMASAGSATATAPIKRSIIKPAGVPEIASAIRIRQNTPFGNMHVNVVVDPKSDSELEVFTQLGKGGEVAASDLEAICRLASLWLRSGGELKYVVKQLRGIGSTLQVPTKDGKIMSLGDGLATALQKYLDAKQKFGLSSLLVNGMPDLTVGVVMSTAESAGTRSEAAKMVKITTPSESSVPTAFKVVKDRANGAFKVKCPECDSYLVNTEGCIKCINCGYSQC